MNSIQDLFNFILHQEQTIVFGNLGRYPKIIYEAIQSIPLIQVTIISKHYPIITSDSRIRVTHDCVDRCDLLIYMEPDTFQSIQKHPLTSHVAVFTSHFNFKTKSLWKYVSYFHTTSLDDLADKTQKLLKVQDPSLQTRDPGLVGVEYKNVFITKGANLAPDDNAYIIIDLTKFNTDILSMYLDFWDKFDYMLDHFDMINRWVVCFSDSVSRRAFDSFTQKCIDALFCKNFEHGNVTEITQMLSLIPYYKSGIIDKTFDIPISYFGGIQIIIPKSIEEACKAAIMYDLNVLTNNVYYIRE